MTTCEPTWNSKAFSIASPTFGSSRTNWFRRPLLHTFTRALPTLFSIAAFFWISVCFAQVPDFQFEQRESPYRIDENLTVPFGDYWKIHSGTHLCFEDGVLLKVDGILVADGTKDAPIVLSSCNPEHPWGGIHFSDSRQQDNLRSAFRHVVIERASKILKDAGSTDPNANGGGIFVERSDLEVTNSTIRHNRANTGGGLYIGAESDVVVMRSAIYGNIATGSPYINSGGGGIYVAGPRRLDISHSVICPKHVIWP